MALLYVVGFGLHARMSDACVRVNSFVKRGWLASTPFFTSHRVYTRGKEFDRRFSVISDPILDFCFQVFFHRSGTPVKSLSIKGDAGVLFKQRWHLKRADDGAGMHGHQRDLAKGGNCLEMFGNASFSLLEISIV